MGSHEPMKGRVLVTPKSSLLRLVIDGIPIHVFTCSTLTGQVTWVNQRTMQYTGRTLQDHLGLGWLVHMHPDDQADYRKQWDLAFDQGNGFTGEYRLRRFDGIYRCFLWRVVPLRDLKGRILHWFGTCTDVHDQRVAKENTLRQMEIESSERKYRLLAEAIPQIVFTFSPGIGLTYANGKWETYANQPFERTRGLGFMLQVHPEDRHKLQLPDLVRHKSAGVSWQNEIRLQSGQGDYNWFLVKCISVDELDTGQVRWFGTCTDINDHKLLEHKLKEAHDAAQKSTESKTRFLSNMSHEIRTPLIGITGMLNFLLDTELTAEQVDYAHTIQQSAESLLVVINDILDLSKVEAGMMKLEWEAFSLVAMIEDANELLSTLAVQKGLELSFWANEDVPSIVVGDRIRLRQVLLNLIGNAIKFTSHGEVYTQCSLQHYDKEESELTILFEVVDTGTGFDAEEEAIMFKPFSQVDSSSTRKHGGSGLGLVISRQLIELHGGKMYCKSQKNKGSTFYFTAKFGVSEPQTKLHPQTPQNEVKDPFFRPHACTLREEDRGSKMESEPPTDPTKATATNTPPSVPLLVHPKIHAQEVTLPHSMESLHDVLLNKAAVMQLIPPPVRTVDKSIGSDPIPPEKSTLRALDKSLSTPMALGTRRLRGSVSHTTFGSLGNASPTHPTPILMNDLFTQQQQRASQSLMPVRTSPGLLSPNINTAPPRIPTHGFPLRILIVCEWPRSLSTIVKHSRFIFSTLTQPSHLEIETATSAIEAVQLLASPLKRAYDYTLLNLASEQQIISLMRTICGTAQQYTQVLIVTTPMQRSLITEHAKRENGMLPRYCGFVFKPLRRSKLNWYYGITPRTLVKDMVVLDTSQQRILSQKEVFRQMEADVGGKGFRVLLVEDNPVNQKVLTRYLVRVGLQVDVACDGEVCTQLFYSHPHTYYSLILCDLFMPVKDGYEATREIREWETAHLITKDKQIPIIALSANVMSDVAEKCLASGFSTYISKPVNFAMLSDIIRGYLMPH
ncbi:hypothetical protein BDF14DRAFT_1754573 [Spinellus fusiger]|nr:hypothetical protein BDF14DRAFT_1754573 [Spinellus fusiger]